MNKVLATIFALAGMGLVALGTHEHSVIGTAIGGGVTGAALWFFDAPEMSSFGDKALAIVKALRGGGQ
jgi:hypothetical protein